MAIINNEISRTFSEYLLEPGLTTAEHSPDKIDLSSPFCKFKKGEKPKITLKSPMVSAVMQAVSGKDMGIALAKEGGVAFIYVSQPIDKQAEMVSRVKKYKAGFVRSKFNLSPESTLEDAYNLTKETGYSTLPVTENGEMGAKLLGILTDQDYWPRKDDLNTKVKEKMTPFKDLVYGEEGITLEDANILLWKNKKSILPIIDKKQNLKYLVFKKDYEEHRNNPLELIDEEKRLIVGAGLNSRDYKERCPALVEAGVDAVCFDSSDGYSTYQYDAVKWVKETYPDLIVGAGNVVDKQGFDYLVEAGADFIKVGIGGGSICITREQKGIGKGQASAVGDVAKARDEYFKKKGIYVPLCSDGGIVHDYHMTLALAFGADFVMMGRYFARCKESPTETILRNNMLVKPYWGEGSARARNWQRYANDSSSSKLMFEEGVEGYVPVSGTVKENLSKTLYKIKSTMGNIGCVSISDMHKNAKVRPVSQLSLVEGGAHNIIKVDQFSGYGNN
ncbi:inosine 5-monophosphate dehydrogenase [archaeon D22]|nr:inosine 5-monophosphate dehydrogenase [archaeon D22]